MAGQRFVLTMVLFIAVAGSISDISQTVYGENVWQPTESNEVNEDNSLIDELGDTAGGIVGGALSEALSLFGFLIPDFTGIWFIDNLILNPLGFYAGYKAIVFIRGGGG